MYMGIGAYDNLRPCDQKVFLRHMMASTVKLTQLLENAEQPKDEFESYSGNPH